MQSYRWAVALPRQLSPASEKQVCVYSCSGSIKGQRTPCSFMLRALSFNELVTRFCSELYAVKDMASARRSTESVAPILISSTDSFPCLRHLMFFSLNASHASWRPLWQALVVRPGAAFVRLYLPSEVVQGRIGSRAWSRFGDKIDFYQGKSCLHRDGYRQLNQRRD